MFHELLSFVVHNEDIYVQFHRAVFLLVIVADVLVQIFASFPKKDNTHRISYR